MAALDLVPDFGERVSNGELIDELLDVLVLMPPHDGPGHIWIAAAIARHRCDGRSLPAIRKALRDWRPEGRPQ